MGQQHFGFVPQVSLATQFAAQPEDGSALQLRTTGTANRAYLEQDMQGRVHLYFRGLRFAVEDLVPNSLVGIRHLSPSVTAGEFVSRQMLRDYGYHEDQWPDLACKFLLRHSPLRTASHNTRNASGAPG